MKRAFQTVGLFGKYQDDDVVGPLLQLGRFLKTRGLQVLIDESAARRMPEPIGQALPFERLGPAIDLAIVIGGDGTLLHVARHLSDYEVPIIGVNQGRLGFLTDIALADMEQEVGRILDGKSQIEPRLLLHAEIERNGEILHTARAFNDVIISKGELARLIEYETYIGDEFVNSARGDGVIVASPTGSTAYAMSAGGPILQPTLPVLALVPICPHTLSNRPIMVSADSLIQIVILELSSSHAHVTFDGQSNFMLAAGDRVNVRRAKRSVKLLRPIGRNHYDVLREKLHWGTKY
ncbi:MAG: NAD(+) kinase [Gammaproteobacteria bacterium]|nr:NAD(+) kinase [Gammaproteobacteria bacterium]